MKKLFVMVILAVMATGLFALDLGGIKGTWKDSKWDADWTFSADGHIVLSLSSTGEKIYQDCKPELLFEALEIEPDWERIRYYILLDELF